MKELVIIPARAGSQRIKNKNIKKLNGKPLVEYSIDHAKSIFDNNKICVTTDCTKIKNIALQKGLNVPFLRPKELSSDTSPTQDAIMHAIDWYEKNQYIPDVVILLQPTSPLRDINDIKKAMEIFNMSIDMVVSVKKSKSNPYYNLFEEENGFLYKSKKSTVTRSQDGPEVWEFDGSIYIINVKSLKNNQIKDFTKIIKYEIKNPLRSVDVDDMIDFDYAEFILKEKKI